MGISIRTPIHPGYPVRWQIRQTGITTTTATTNIQSQCPAHIVFPDMLSPIMAISPLLEYLSLNHPNLDCL